MLSVRLSEAIMLQNLFWFGGRMGRLAFFGWSFASIGVAILVLLALVLVASPVSTGPSKILANPRDAGMVAGAGTAIVLIWMSFALQVKRLRDMGRDPFVWIVGVWTVLVLDQFVLTSYIDARYSSYAFGMHTPLGGIVSTVYWICLVFMPSADHSSAYDMTKRAGLSPANRLKYN